VDYIVGFVQTDIFDSVLFPFTEHFVNLLAAFDLRCVESYNAGGGFELEDSGKPVVAFAWGSLTGF
jgi:hypothetical protein